MLDENDNSQINLRTNLGWVISFGYLGLLYFNVAFLFQDFLKKGILRKKKEEDEKPLVGVQDESFHVTRQTKVDIEKEPFEEASHFTSPIVVNQLAQKRTIKQNAQAESMKNNTSTRIDLQEEEKSLKAEELQSPIMKRKLNKVFPIQKDSSPAAFSKMVTSREELLVSSSIADAELQTKPLDEDASPHDVLKRIFARRTTSKMNR